MPHHKAARGEKPAATRTRSKGPGRHAYGVPTLTQDEILAVYPFLGGPAFVPVEEPEDDVSPAAVVPVSVAGLSDPEDIAAAWSSEADKLERARQERIGRAEERRLARERAAADAAERARLDAESEAERIRALRDTPEQELGTVEAEPESVEATASDVEEELAAWEAEAEAVDTEADEAELLSAASDEGEPAIAFPSFFDLPAEPVQPLPLDFTLPAELPETIDDEHVESATDDEADEADTGDGVFLFPFDSAETEPGLDDSAEPAVEEALSIPVAPEVVPVPTEADTDEEPAAEPVATPEFSFDDIIGEYEAEAEAPEHVDSTVATDVEAEVEDVTEAEVVEEPATVVAELVEDTTRELTPAAPPQEVVHIHHHYHEPSEPVAPQIIIAPPPVYASEWPEGVPVAPFPPQDAPRRERRPQRPAEDAPRTDFGSDRNVTESHFDHYVEQEPERDRRPVVDDGPIQFEKPKREPFFTWRGRPIGGGTGKDQGRPSGQRAIEPRRTQSSAARLLADGTEGVTDVDPQTWFDDVVQESIERDASDLHIRVESDGSDDGSVLRARVRIDGRMRHLATLTGGNAGVIINRFKTGASLSSDGSFVPEESVYEVPVDGEFRKARVALFRTSTGGDALVLRLPPRGALRTLDDLNFAPKNEQLVRELLGSANRMVMIAGPMGSGKTTTAQAALLSVTTPERSVWSLEDPVERDLPNVTQLELDERNGAGFDAVLPVLVRSDYDTLFLGEIRDPATAGAGVRQAKAGRQVITTIHANDNVGALYRLIELSGESPREVLDSVAGVLSQRLVGRLNPDWDGEDPETKYRGRVPIHEVLRITPELIEAVMRDEPITKVQALAAATSESMFIADAQRLVNERVTDVEEVSRVLGLPH
jgi:type II secretory ATPase GspE/PulE/Tfp pilus assembly ATPase PilB-like protein